ncbi:MFS transporter [Pseudaestuariivita atlantica]|uniref:Membrane protein n=1 Tax=Pseudaestuariivita atlantica TaxID=1317121 RepID=A0A0L1JLJ6_9RHOB|nr:MFS transporter [Pseudaestuariivita atlantica]KNG92621.1 membrane protein [Pseudaestuariivita atlantica]
MRLFLTLAALYLSVLLLQLSSGGVGPLDALSGLKLGFTTPQIGLLGSAHFFGFFIGCWWAPRLMGEVGPSRAYAAFTALGAIGLLAHILTDVPLAWALFRVMSGLCIAGSYTVIEAWLQARATNETRGRAMGTYRIVDLGASLAAQAMIGVLEPASYISYTVLTLICCAAILPLAMTRLTPPPVGKRPRLDPRLPLARSPLAVAAVLVAALGTAAFRMVGPVYAETQGLTAGQIALFLSAFVAGGALSQYPVGWIADAKDRRWVLIWLSAAAAAASLATATLPSGPPWQTFALAALFGFTSMPIYSVAAAHAHDFAASDERVELSAALLFYYALGAIAAPLGASWLMQVQGPGALFALIAAGHVVLVIFGLARMRVRPADAKTRYVWTPRTSFTIGGLTRRDREKKP